MILKDTGIILLTTWLYYRSFVMAFFLIPLWIWQLKMMAKEKQKKKELQFQIQFKDTVLAVSSALNTGYSVENAFREAQKEMQLIYPEEARISKELMMMVRQMNMQIPMEKILSEFAERMTLEDVNNFVQVFVAARKTGGDMIAIIKNTATQIDEKIEVRREIHTILAAKRYEFQVMSAIPYAIIGYMTLSFPQFMECLYGNVIGIGVMTVCLLGYWSAYYLGTKIIEIEI